VTGSGDEAAAAVEPTDLKWVGPATAEALEDADFDAADLADKRVSCHMLVEAGVNPGVAAKIRREHSLAWSFESTDDLDRRSAQIRGLGDAEAAWVAASAGDWESAEDDVDAEADDGAARVAAAAPAPAADDAGEGGDGSDPATDRPGLEGTGDWPAPTGEAAEAAGIDAASADGDGTPAEADGSGDPVVAEAAWRERSAPTPLTELDSVGEDDAAALSEAGITSVRSLATADPEHLADVLELDGDRVAAWHEAARDAADDRSLRNL